MSEYNNFLKYFYKMKNDREKESQQDNNEHEDVIELKDNKDTNDESKKDNAQNTEKESDSKDYFSDIGNKNNQNSTFVFEVFPEKEEPKFIKTNSVPVISAKNDKGPEMPTAVEKYTDRLDVKAPETKKHSGYTGKINTYAANHSPSDDLPKFIPLTEDKNDNKEELKQPQKKPVDFKTKHIGRIDKKNVDEAESKVIIEKLPTDNTKAINFEKGELLREIAISSENLTEEEGLQLTMEGFDQLEEAANNTPIDEEILQQEVENNRKKRINNFRFWSKQKPVTGESEDESLSAPNDEKRIPGFVSIIQDRFRHVDTDFVTTGANEYDDPAKRKEIFSSLIKERKMLIIKMFIVGILGVILLLINIIASVSASSNNGFFTILFGNTVAYNTINLITLLFCGLLMFKDLKNGFFDILKIRPKTDSVLLFVFCICLAQNIASYFTMLKPESEYHLLSNAVIILFVPILLSKIFYCDSVRHCFKVVGNSGDKSYLRIISDDNIRSVLLKDATNTEKNVVYAGKTRFISGFLKRCRHSAFAAQSSSKIIAVSMAISILCGIIALIHVKSLVYALGAAAFCASLSLPLSSLLFLGFILASENQLLSVKSSCISGYSESFGFSLIDDIVIEGCEIFSAELTNVSCATKVSEKQAEFCVAALLHNTNGILRKTFDKYISEYEEKLPEAEDLIIEDKLGISAWISNCKVLLGTKEYLHNHNVELPENDNIFYVSNSSEKPLFLSIEGHFAAVFTLKYSCNDVAVTTFAKLVNNGINLLVNTDDPNITEEYGELLLGLPENSLRIIKNNAYTVFEKQKNTVTDSESTGIIFNDKIDSLCRTISGAIDLNRIKKMAKIVGEAGSLIGAIFGFIIVLSGAVTCISGWLVAVVQLLWCIILFGIVPMLVDAEKKPAKKVLGEVKNISKKIIQSTDKNAEMINADSSMDLDVQENENKNAKTVEAPVFSEHSPGIKEDSSEQLIMQGAPYTEPPKLIDFSKITGDEYKEDKEDLNENELRQTVSNDILDAYAESNERMQRRAKEADNSVQETKKSKKSAGAKTAEGKSGKRSILSFLDEKIPEPPRFALKKDKKDSKDDFLNVQFVPPETNLSSTIYNDDFFASFDTKDDDKTFSDVRKRRSSDKLTNNDFDF